LHDDIVIIEFDRNFNFISETILLNVNIYLKNYKNYNFYRMNLIESNMFDIGSLNNKYRQKMQQEKYIFR
jgi:hypothetical protein